MTARFDSVRLENSSRVRGLSSGSEWKHPAGLLPQQQQQQHQMQPPIRHLTMSDVTHLYLLLSFLEKRAHILFNFFLKKIFIYGFVFYFSKRTGDFPCTGWVSAKVHFVLWHFRLMLMFCNPPSASQLISTWLTVCCTQHWLPSKGKKTNSCRLFFQRGDGKIIANKSKPYTWAHEYFYSTAAHCGASKICNLRTATIATVIALNFHWNTFSLLLLFENCLLSNSNETGHKCFHFHCLDNWLVIKGQAAASELLPLFPPVKFKCFWRGGGKVQDLLTSFKPIQSFERFWIWFSAEQTKLDGLLNCLISYYW